MAPHHLPAIADVLIVGSSRALRGIDPTALEQSLTTRGIAQVRVFNLGIDGATARVAELKLTRILGDRTLPRLVIWADGLRAFNSSRRDSTYEEIAASEGYGALAQSVTSAPSPTSAPPPERGIAF
ncbi:MAG: hypothetical protein HC919_01480 [Oscillatoriales cyanobacterium SM2_2_1]|nr:hypothetical protein [Oscillatoriales cyanobacterium SM2_2_1]